MSVIKLKGMFVLFEKTLSKVIVIFPKPIFEIKSIEYINMYGLDILSQTKQRF